MYVFITSSSSSNSSSSSFGNFTRISMGICGKIIIILWEKCWVDEKI